MKFLASLAVAALATQTVVGDSWFGKTGDQVYNKWHETELERWLSDHSVPYPTPADRKDLENLVKDNWDGYVVRPYNKWDTNQLTNYLKSSGREIEKGSEQHRASLINQVQNAWHETTDQASDAYSSVQDWIFDTWTESQLKSFLDYNSVPNPSPRSRDSLLFTARSNYQKAAEKAGEYFAYPGDWVWQGWSESDMKSWLDERGIPAPQPTNRDKLIASLRRNSRLASVRANEAYASASASAQSAQQSLSDQLLNSWSDSEIKAWCDKNGIKVPQGSRRNELIALARKHSAQLSGNNAKGSAASAYGAATSSAGNLYAQASGDLYSQGRYYYDWVLNQLGMASADAQKSLSSVSSVASAQASQSSATARSSLSSASVQASKSASSASKSASSAASSAKKEL